MKLKRWTKRDDGMVFWYYTTTGKEVWLTNEEAMRRHVANRNLMRERYKKPEVAERSRAYSKKWRQSNPQRAKENLAKWNAANKTRRSFNNGLKKAKARGGFVELTQDEEKMMMDWYAWRDLLNGVHGRIAFHLDHNVPFWSGGKHHPLNVRVTTEEYNLTKGQGIAPELFEEVFK